MVTGILPDYFRILVHNPNAVRQLLLFLFLPTLVYGQNWECVTPYDGPNGTINAIAFYNSEIYLGGDFTEIGGLSSNNGLAKWNGTTYIDIAPNMTLGNGVFDIFVFNGELYIAADSLYKLIGSSLINVAGSLGSWSSPHGLCEYNSKIYFWVGELRYYDGISIGTDGLIDGGGLLQVYNGEFYCTRVNSLGEGLYKYDNGWVDVLGTWVPTGDITTLAVYDNKLIVGGNFNNSSGLVGKGIAAYDGANWSPFGDLDFSELMHLWVVNSTLYCDYFEWNPNINMIEGFRKYQNGSWVPTAPNWYFRAPTSSISDIEMVNNELHIVGSDMGWWGYNGSNWGSNTQSSCSGSWKSKFQRLTGSIGINNPYYGINILQAFPNPTTGTLTVEGVEGTASVYDIYGRMVLTSNTNTLDISNAADGIYFVRIVDEEGRVFTAKVVKE